MHAFLADSRFSYVRDKHHHCHHCHHHHHHRHHHHHPTIIFVLFLKKFSTQIILLSPVIISLTTSPFIKKYFTKKQSSTTYTKLLNLTTTKSNAHIAEPLLTSYCHLFLIHVLNSLKIYTPPIVTVSPSRNVPML